jgi:hypothetical protein
MVTPGTPVSLAEAMLLAKGYDLRSRAVVELWLYSNISTGTLIAFRKGYSYQTVREILISPKISQK